MTLNKKKMVREIGRRTRIRNRDVQAVIEALIEVWTEELVSGGRIEIEHFLIIETQVLEPCSHRIKLGTSKVLRDQMNAARSRKEAAENGFDPPAALGSQEDKRG